jgi:hypothetical protein
MLSATNVYLVIIIKVLFLQHKLPKKTLENTQTCLFLSKSV